MTRDEFRKKHMINEQEREEGYSSLSPQRAETFTERYQRQKKEADYNSMMKSIGASAESIRSSADHYQSPDWVQRKKQESTKAYSQAKSIADKYADDADFQNAFKEYSAIFNDYDFDTTAEMFSKYRNADAFNRANEKNQLERKYAGKSYDEIEEAKKTATGAEKNYLDSYKSYSSVEDFDKAIERETKKLAELQQRDAAKGNNRTIKSATLEGLKSAKADYESSHASEKYKSLLDDAEFAKNTDYQGIINAELGEGDSYKDIAGRGLAYGIRSDIPYLLSIEDEDTKRIAAGIYNTQGKDAYIDYLESISRQVSKEQFANSAVQVREQSVERPFASTITNTLLGMGLQIGAGLENLVQSIDGVANPYGGLQGAYAMTQEGINAVRDNIDSNVGKFFYDTVTTTATSRLGQRFFGDIYNVVMGIGAYASTYKREMESGASEGEAIRDAFISGATEWLTEELGMEWAVGNKLSKGLNNSILKIGASMLEGGSAEALEELAGNFINFVADNLGDKMFGGTNNETTQKYQQYLTMGYDGKEALLKTAGEFAGDTLYQMLVAFASAAPDTAVIGGKNIFTGRNIDAQKLAEAMDTFGEDSEARQSFNELAGRYGVENLSALNRGELFSAAANEARSDYTKAFNAKDFQKAENAVMNSNALLNAVNETKSTRVRENEKDLTSEQATELLNKAYIERSSKAYNDVEAQLYRENYNGQNSELYTANFDYIANAAHRQTDLEEVLQHVTPSAMAKSKAIEIYNAIRVHDTEVGRIATEANDKILAKWDGEYSKKGNLTLNVDQKNLTKEDKRVLGLVNVLTHMGMDIDVIKDSKQENGWVTNSDNKITLNLASQYHVSKDLDKGRYVVNTLAHESTHWMENVLGKEEFGNFKNLIRSHVGNDTWDRMVALEISRDKNLSPEDAESEATARFCEDMLNDMSVADRLFESASKTQIQRIADAIKKFFEKIRDDLKAWMKGYDSRSNEARLLRQMDGAFAQVQKAWGDMFERALQINQARETENQAIENAGIEILSDDIAYNKKTLDESWLAASNEKEVKKVGKVLAKRLGLKGEAGLAKAEEYVKNLHSIAAIEADNKYLQYVDTGLSAWVSNSDYGGNFDFSYLCPKRLVYTGTMSAIRKKLNKPMTPTQFLALRRFLIDNHYDAPCSYCYVESTRINSDKLIQKNFLDKPENKKYNLTLRQLTDADSLEQLRQEWLTTGKDNGFEAFEKAMNKLSQRKPKALEKRRAYHGEILQSNMFTPAKVAEINFNRGLRFFAFSDFEVPHMLDLMQVITDMSTRGLAGFAYTKQANFVEVFGGTGLKINMSTVAKGVDKSGRIIFDDIEGMNSKDALKLREKYSQNVGIVCVVLTDAQLKAALADDRIDYVLPFHRSQWSKEMYSMMGLPADTKDFTVEQTEKQGDETARKTESNILVSSYWDDTLSGRENAQKYLNICNERGITPIFRSVLEYEGGKETFTSIGKHKAYSGGKWILPEGAVGDGYYKVLIEQKMYDNEGNPAPQMPVMPDFDMAEANRIASAYNTDPNIFPVANNVVNEFMEWHKNGEKLFSKKAVEDITEDYSDPKNEQKKFSNKLSIESTEYLMARHNVSQEQLLKTIKLGGFALPSIAIMKQYIPHSEFGDSTVVFAKATIDPQYKKNPVYSGDAYTPIFPTVDKKISREKQQAIEDRVEKLVGGRSIYYKTYNTALDYDNMTDKLNRFDVATSYGNNDVLKYAFLQETGNGFEIPMVEKVMLEGDGVSNNSLGAIALTLGDDLINEMREGGYQWYDSHPEIVDRIRLALNEAYIKENPVPFDGDDDGKAFKRRIIDQHYHMFDDEEDGKLSWRDFEKVVRAMYSYRSRGAIQEIDNQRFKDMVRERVDQAAYEKWLDKLFEGIIEKEGIRNDKDMFTASGNRRSWEALHDEVNLENVVKKMAKEEPTGLGMMGSNIFGASTKRYGSIEEIRKDMGRLMSQDEEERDRIRTEISNKLHNLIYEVVGNEKDAFSAARKHDDVYAMFCEAIRKSRTVEGIDRYLQKESKGFYTIKADVAHRLLQIVNEIEAMPTEYFEAKPTRAVDLGEIAYVVVPSETNKDLLKAFEDNNITYYTYEKDNEEDRFKVVNENAKVEEGTLFSHKVDSVPTTALEKAKYYTYDNMVSLPDIKVIRLHGESTTDRKRLLEEAKDNIEKNGFKKGVNYYTHVNSLGVDVMIPTNALKHGLIRKLESISKIMPHIGEVLNNAVLINEMTPKNQEATNSYILVGVAEDDDYTYVTEFVVNKFTQKVDEINVLYSAHTKKDSVAFLPELAANATSRPESFTMSISELLDYVNRLFPDALPEDVLRHYGEKERPDGLLGKSALYSKKVKDDTYDLLDQTARLGSDAETFKRDINRLARLVNLQKKAPNGMLFSPKRLNIIADRLLRNSDVNYDKEDLINGLNRAYAEITDAFSNESDTTAQDIMDACTFLASKITDPAKAVIETEDADTNMVINEFSQSERIEEIAREIYNNYWTVASMNLGEAVADKVQSLNEEHREAMSKLRQSRDKALAELRQNKNEVIKKIREDRDKKFEEFKEARKQMEAERKKNAEKNAYVKKITDNATTLLEWIRKNDPKGGKYVPEGLKPAVTKLLEAIDFSSKQALGMRGGRYSGMTTRRDREIASALADIREYMFTEHDDEIFIDLHENIVAEMKNIINAINTITESGNEFVLNKMDTKDLQTLDMVMTALKTSITNINKRIGTQRKGEISEIAIPDIMNNRELGQKENSKYTKGVKAFFEWTNTLPQYAFEHLGTGATEMFQEMRDGWSKFAFNTKKIIDFAEANWTGEEYDEWSKNIHDFEVGGTHVKMTDTQIMSLYCLAKREQALKHIYQGGITVASFEGKNGKIVEQAKDVVLTQAEIDSIVSTLSERQIKVADAIQQFMNDTCKEWMNDVTMKRWGIKGATEENYFPITVDSTSLVDTGEPKDMPKSIFKLLNMGFTKPLNEKASNPLVVDDIVDVFKVHATDMAKYNALALPVLDMHRYYNFKQKTEDGDVFNMKKSMQTAYGDKALSYVTKFLLDLNSNREESRGGGMFKLAKGYKVAAVAGNLQVAALQPVAVTRARMYLSKKDLLKGFFHIQSGINAMLDNSGIAVWKDLSLFDTDIASGVDSKIKQNRTWKDKFVEWTMKLAETMDKVTWGAIWSACEAEQSANGLKGEELTKATLKEFDDIIYHTQVVDSTMTRSEIMRGNDPYTKMITSFMSEPTISMNLLQDAGVRYAQDVRRYGKAEALKRNASHIAKCCYIYTLNAGIEAILRGLMGKYRDWDEDSDEMLSNLWKEFLQNIVPIGNIPIGRDIVSLLMGYNVDRMDMASIQSIITAGKNLSKVISGEKELDYKTIYRAMQAISQATGIPLSSLMRDGSAFWNDTVGQMYPSLKIE